jgi:Putative zinc-finger
MQVADHNQFGSTKPGIPGDPRHCAQCEAMLTDALDGTLSAADQATFDLHMVGCPACATMLADAQRGAAWMELLKSDRPEPPASLIERILAQTSNPPAPPIVLGPTDRLRTPAPHVPNTLLGRPALVPTVAGHPAVYAPTNILPFRARFTHGLRSIGHTMLQPRLAMTAAMAFFSIALTLNLTGVHLSSLRASDLKPSSILRSAYETKARVVRYSDNLRVVYELESRVRDLQRSGDNGSSSSTPAPQNTPQNTPAQNPDGAKQPDGQTPGSNPDQKQNRPKPKPGSSRREAPAGNLLLVQFAQRPSEASPAQSFVVASPSIFKQEGELV